MLSPASQIMFLKYQLPSEPNVYVDLLDDEDVSLMFDEVHIPLPSDNSVQTALKYATLALTCGKECLMRTATKGVAGEYSACVHCSCIELTLPLTTTLGLEAGRAFSTHLLLKASDICCACSGPTTPHSTRAPPTSCTCMWRGPRSRQATPLMAARLICWMQRASLQVAIAITERLAPI